MEDLGSAKGSFVLLARDAWEVLDCGTAVSPWPSGLQRLCHLRPNAGDNGPHHPGCVYSREVWSILLSKLHLHDLVLVQEENVLAWWLRSRKLVTKQVRKGFDSLFFLVGWTLCKERNARTFNGVSRSVATLATLIQDEAEERCLAGYKRLLSLLTLP